MSESNNSGYEKKDVSVSKIVGVTVVVLVTLAAILLFMTEFFIFSKEKMIFEQVLKPESAQLRDLRAREDQVLNSYKVLDANKGTYQIPIDRAIKLVADEAFEQRKERRSN